MSDRGLQWDISSGRIGCKAEKQPSKYLCHGSILLSCVGAWVGLDGTETSPQVGYTVDRLESVVSLEPTASPLPLRLLRLRLLRLRPPLPPPKTGFRQMPRGRGPFRAWSTSTYTHTL